MKNITNWLKDLFASWNFSPSQTETATTAVLFLGLLLVAWILNIIAKKIIDGTSRAIIRKTKTEYDDIILQEKVFTTLSHFIPALVIYFGVSYITSYQGFINVVKNLAYIYLIVIVLFFINRLLTALDKIYEIYAEKKNIKIHIKHFVQAVKIIFVVIGIILIISILLNKKPGAILAGMGAMTAIIVLIFKDSILSFVAGIQLSAYQMVKEGDWITVPSRGIDGDVLEISLNTVKIRNFDKTIATVPTYALVQESFINWKGMEQSGGRRIKRAIYVDMNSIKLCDADMLKNLKKIKFLQDYINQIEKEHQKSIEELAETQAITNITLFRRYVEEYIKANFRVYKKYKKQKFTVNNTVLEKFVIDDVEEFKKDLDKDVDQFLTEIDGKTVINDTNKFVIRYSDKYVAEGNYLYKIRKTYKNVIKSGKEVKIQDYEKILLKPGLFCDDYTALVRQLPPTDKGLPIEIYVFAATTDWGTYEQIQAALFEHLLAMLPVFGLKPFQQPSGADLKALTTADK